MKTVSVQESEEDAIVRVQRWPAVRAHKREKGR